MALKEGLYHIRFVPICIQPPFFGGVYATAADFGEPILAEPENAGELQTWAVRRLENGKYTITQPNFKSKHSGLPPLLLGWSLPTPHGKTPVGNILFKTDYVELDIYPTGEGEHLMYSVIVPAPHGWVGSVFVVTETNQVLNSQPFMAGVEFPPPQPHWQFIPAKPE